MEMLKNMCQFLSFRQVLYIFICIFFSTVLSCSSSGKKSNISFQELVHLSDGVYETESETKAQTVSDTASNTDTEKEPEIKEEKKYEEKEKKSTSERLSFLFVPFTSSQIDSEDISKVSVSIYEYAKLFNIDFIVLSGRFASIIDVTKESKGYTSVEISTKTGGVLITNKEFSSKNSNGFYTFPSFAIQIYSKQDEVDENIFESGSSKKNDVDYNSSVFSSMRSYKGPVLVFASPLEPSYFDDYVSLISLPDGYKIPFKFVYSFEENGFIDIYNSLRFSMNTIGFLHSGYTYISDNYKKRIDFVMCKNAIPESIEMVYLPHLSDKDGIKRYAIKGSVVI